MNEILNLILAFILGLALGALFFGGLWLTVKRAVTAKIPALWVFGSLFLRISITLMGFYFIASGGWQGLLVCLAGFIIARVIVLRITKQIDQKKMPLKKEDINEA